MAAKTVVTQQFLKPIKILKWKVREGNSMTIGRIILVYQFAGSDATEQLKLKSAHAGIVSKIIRNEGAVIQKGEPLLELEACIHPTVMNDMCAECGTDLRKDDIATAASVPMVHSIPELKVSEELAQKLGKADGERLLRDRKLVLLVDLDQTLIHTTNDNIPANIKDVFHFQLYGPTSPWYHTRFRPRTLDFLFNISSIFELHICTFGARNYAHTIAMLLDPDQQYFSNRILSRDECFDATSKKANLKALFPCGDDMVCIIDDREDVWSHALNLIHVKPYHFFQHTGDINAPPGLNKQENDNEQCVDLTKIKVKSKENGNTTKISAESSGDNERSDCSDEKDGPDSGREDMYEPDIKDDNNDDDKDCDSDSGKEDVQSEDEVTIERNGVLDKSDDGSMDKEEIKETEKLCPETKLPESKSVDIETAKEESNVDSKKTELIRSTDQISNTICIEKPDISKNIADTQIAEEFKETREETKRESEEESKKQGDNHLENNDNTELPVSTENPTEKQIASERNESQNETTDVISDKIVNEESDVSSKMEKEELETSKDNQEKSAKQVDSKIEKEEVSKDNQKKSVQQVDSKIEKEEVSKDNQEKSVQQIDSKIEKEEVSKDNQEKSVQQVDSKIEKEEVSKENQEKSVQQVDSKIEKEEVSKDNQETSVEQIDSKPPEDDGMVEVDDPDDYLLYLEDVLRRIHTTFYEEYDKLGDGTVPDLKQVIPRVRAQVLAGTRLVFSGLVPTHAPLEQSRAFQVARGLGASVAAQLGPDTTHLVAVRAGTAKVNAARRRCTTTTGVAGKRHSRKGERRPKGELKVVTPDWLWCCAERWERVREEVFPLSSAGSKNRHPPPHCGSPEHNATYPTHETPSARKRTPSGRFMDTINPLMSFSSDDIADMDKEVEDMLDDESESDDDPPSSSQHTHNPDHFPQPPPPNATDLTTLSGNNSRHHHKTKTPRKPPPPLTTTNRRPRPRTNSSSSNSSSSSAESLTGEFPRGFKRNRAQRKRLLGDDDDDDDDVVGLGEEDDDLDEFPSAKFRRGEELGSDLDIGQGSNSEGSDEPREDVSDGDWNMMGAALEREFLSNN